MKLNLSGNIKGILYLSGGIISFLYINKWFQSELYYLMLAGSIAAITYGFIVTDMWDKLNELVNKIRKISRSKNSDSPKN
jgi:phosphotransferase system  glucose/maltose/N-acetylglucosamine-specific IIC component